MSLYFYQGVLLYLVIVSFGAKSIERTCEMEKNNELNQNLFF